MKIFQKASDCLAWFGEVGIPCIIMGGMMIYFLYTVLQIGMAMCRLIVRLI